MGHEVQQRTNDGRLVYEGDTYGATEVIYMRNSEEPSKTVRVYPGAGMRVGCTFVDRHAMEHIVAAWQRRGKIA